MINHVISGLSSKWKLRNFYFKDEVTQVETIMITITKTTKRFFTFSMVNEDDDDDNESDDDIGETEIKKRFSDLSIMADDN